MSDKKYKAGVEFMNLALKLAEKADGFTSPNPLVGAVVVKNSKIIGQGYHKKAGMPHAEIEAFRDAESRGENLKSSTLYVTLEPCCHKGKRTPPCTDSIINKGISKVVIGTTDPNPKVSGRGINQLRNKGISVETGVLEEKCVKLNEAFNKFISTGTPFVILKLACTLDGKIATVSGDSKWIGSEKQRSLAHKLRQKVDAVMVGINTVIQDNPRLNVRLKKKEISHPVPVIVDNDLRISPDSNIFKIHHRPIIATTEDALKGNISGIKERCRLIITDRDNKGNVDITDLFKKLGDESICSVLVEGGSRIAGSVLRSHAADKIILFYAPKLVGGDGVDMFSSLGVVNMVDSLSLKDINIKKFGNEFMLEAYPDMGILGKNE